MHTDITIIGSGLGGLLCGYLLSKEGVSVRVLEKHRKPGGCLQTFRRGIYTFDTGVHYIGSLAPGQTLDRYWNYFGLSGHPDLVPMDRDGFDVISFPDMEYPMAQGSDHFREMLLPHFPQAGSVLKSYAASMDEVVKKHPLYTLELPGSIPGFPAKSLNAFDFLNKLCSGHSSGSSGISLSSVLAGNNFLYAGDPVITPYDMVALINHSFISSAWRMAGGSQKIADLLAGGIRAFGGEVLDRKEVNRITRAREVFTVCTADGDEFTSDGVISDIHPSQTLKLLDGIRIQRAYQERIRNIPNTISAFSLYLGLKPGTFPYLNHNVYHHTSGHVWTAPTSAGERWPESFLFMTPPEAGQGGFAATAVVMATMHFDEFRRWEFTDTGQRQKPYWVHRALLAKRLLEQVYIKFPGLRNAIASIDVSTPLTWRDYTGTPDGSMYGVARDASNPQKTIVFPRTRIPRLYFTGQNISLHGALGVTIGAVMTCGEILGIEYVLKKIRHA